MSLTASLSAASAPATLAAGLGGTITVAALALVPLAVAYWLLTRGARRTPASAGAASGNVLGSLRSELAANYERLRRAGQAVPLAINAWRRLRTRVEAMAPSARSPLVQAYHAIEVSNRLLAAAAAYDARGHLSLRQRRLALWPTLEAAVRAGLAALGERVTPALQAQLRPVTESTAGLPAEAQSRGPVAAASVAGRPFSLSDAPRLALFSGADTPPVQEHRPTKAPAAAERRPRRKRQAARPVRQCDGQMQLWESVA